MKKRKRPPKDKRIPIKGRVGIEERPPQANGKRFGDWEMDTIVGKNGKGAMLTLYERSTAYGILVPLPEGKHTQGVLKAAWRALLPFKDNVLTITTDNRTEFAMHEELARRLETKIYFAHPYSSWEKGGVEKYNKLIRQYIPKQMEINNISKKK